MWRGNPPLHTWGSSLLEFSMDKNVCYIRWWNKTSKNIYIYKYLFGSSAKHSSTKISNGSSIKLDLHSWNYKFFKALCCVLNWNALIHRRVVPLKKRSSFRIEDEFFHARLHFKVSISTACFGCYFCGHPRKWRPDQGLSLFLLLQCCNYKGCLW